MKNIEDLRIAFKTALETDSNFTVHLGVDGTNGIEYLQADLDDQSTISLSNAYLKPLEHWFDNEDLAVVNLSGVDQRDSVLYFYDLPEKPDGFNQLEAVLRHNQPMFSFANHDLGNIKSIAIKFATVENTFLFYKYVYPVSLVKRSNILMIKMGDRLSYFDHDVLKVTSGFDVLLFDGGYYINGFKKFEKSFRFDVIENKIKTDATNSIMALGICDDLKSHLANGIAPARDYIRVASSDVLRLPAATIIAHAETLQSKTGLKIENARIQLNSKNSVRVFMKMLNDDYLRSSLTHYDYDTLAKNKLG